jgi:hypothetical protein
VSSSGAAAHFYNVNNYAEKLDVEFTIIDCKVVVSFEANAARYTNTSIIQMPGHGQLEEAQSVLVFSS